MVALTVTEFPWKNEELMKEEYTQRHKKGLAHRPRQVRAPSQPNFSATAESVLESGMSNSRLSINISGKVSLEHILALESSKSLVQSLSLPGPSIPSWPQARAAPLSTTGTGFAAPSCPLTRLKGDIPKLSVSQGHSKKSWS